MLHQVIKIGAFDSRDIFVELGFAEQEPVLGKSPLARSQPVKIFLGHFFPFCPLVDFKFEGDVFSDKVVRVFSRLVYLVILRHPVLRIESLPDPCHELLGRDTPDAFIKEVSVAVDQEVSGVGLHLVELGVFFSLGVIHVHPHIDKCRVEEPGHAIQRQDVLFHLLAGNAPRGAAIHKQDLAFFSG